MAVAKQVLAPAIGLNADPHTSIALKARRCLQVVRIEEGIQGNGQYAMNASGTATTLDHGLP